jgi:nucleoside-diphosphate-sugar epimerase
LKILVLGANGFIGSRLVRLLKEQALSIRVLTRKPALFDATQLEVFAGDLTDPQLNVDDLLSGCDVVINCAGEIRNEQLMPALHVDAVERLLSAVGRARSRTGRLRWVQLSSVGAYGPAAGRERIVTEQTPANPQGTYEVTKTQADELIMSHPALQGDFADWAILRPSNVFASDMPNASIRQLGAMIRKKLFFYVGYKEAIATYIHADDVAAALVRCAVDPRASRQLYNLSNDCPFSEVVNALAAAQGVSSPRLRVPEGVVRLAVWVAGNVTRLPLTQGRVDALVNKTAYPIGKIRDELNFVPRYSVPAHISEVLK